MADSIKIGNLDISSFKVGSDDCKVYLGDTLLYPTTPPTPPTPSYKWLATYSGGTTSSAECDSSSEIVRDEINGTNLVSVEIGDCVTIIGDSAFDSCTSLTSIDISNSVTSIGDWAFRDCTSLTSCTIGSGLTSIGQAAFVRCTSLTSIEIPSGVTSIGDYAFTYCTSLTSVTVNATTPPSLGFIVFDETNNCPIYVPSELVDVYKTDTNWSYYASKIQAIPNS